MKCNEPKNRYEKGSVMLEYALAAFLLCIPLMTVWIALYNFEEGWTAQGADFAAFFQKVLTGISLPLP